MKITSIDALSPGNHVCAFFSTDEELLAVTADFIDAGLRKDAKIVCVAEADLPKDIAALMKSRGFEPESLLISGQVSFLSAGDVFEEDGASGRDGMITAIDRVMKKALGDGYPSLFMTTEMSWILGGQYDTGRTVDCGELINELPDRDRAALLCQFDLRKFSAAMLLDELTIHPSIVLGSEIFENIYYMTPEEYHSDDPASMKLSRWLRNIRERGCMEKEMRISEERFRKVFESSPVGIAIVDRNHRFISVNSALCSMLGYTAEELTAMTFQQITHPENAAENTDAAVKLYRGQLSVYRTEKRYKKKNGDWMWIDLTTTMTYDSHGSPLNHIAMIVDIDERKRAWEKMEKLVKERTAELEEKNRLLRKEIEERQLVEKMLHKERDILHTSESRLAEAQRIARLGNWDWNIITNELYWSPEIYHIFGLERSGFGATYSAFLERVHPEDREQVISSVNEAIQGRKLYSIDHRIVRPDGSVSTVHEQGEVTFDERERAVRMAGTVQDITVQKETEEKLRHLISELERSNADLEQFAYMASHDLQEPLRMIAGFSKMLEQGYREKLDAEGVEYLWFITDGAQRMQKLICDLLDFSRIITEAMPLKTVDFNEIFNCAARNLSDQIEKTGAVLTCGPLPSADADEMQFVQVFQNLICNAIKFRGCEQPRIHVSAERKNRFWQFAVSDNGMGIGKDSFDRIFVLFQRLNPRQKYPGTGMGLAICKKIVERHGGRIWVDSVPGKGSTFFFTVPAKEENTEHE